MPTVRLYFKNERVGEKFERAITKSGVRVRTAARAAAYDASEEILSRGAADMASAGNFGPRWRSGLHADISEGGANIRISVYHDIPYFSVFQYGATIHGRPLLWIPLSFASDAKGVLARNYPGRLFRVDRKDPSKAPLLLSYATREPKYFGKESVTIPKKFHVIEIVRDVSHKMREFFLRNFH
jgi:hypothetical protein